MAADMKRFSITSIKTARREGKSNLFLWLGTDQTQRLRSGKYDQ